MKNTIYTMMAVLAVFFSACEPAEPTDELPSGEMSMLVTGINQSLSYEFRAGNGRVASSADDVKNLTVMILDEENQIVHETRYYRYYDEQLVPDTILIPSLSAGNYQLLAVTADFYYYYYYEDYYQEGIEDSMGFVASNQLTIPGFTMSEGPIYVGKVDFTLEEEDQVVEIDMTNVSAKVTFKLKNNQALTEAGIEMALASDDVWAYSFDEASLTEDEYGYTYASAYLDEWNRERTLYVMPQTLKSMYINMYSYNQEGGFNQTVAFDEPIALASGDAITFTIDAQALLDGAGEGVFNFGEINWNDRGELSLP